MDAAKTYSIKSWLFEGEGDKDSDKFQSYRFELLEAIKDKTEMFFEISPELESYKAKGFEFRYSPGKPMLNHLNQFILDEEIEVLIPGREPALFIVEYYPYLVSGLLKLEVDLKLLPEEKGKTSRVEKVLSTIIRYEEEVEKYADVVLSALKEKFLNILNELFLIAQKKHLEVADEVENLMTTLGGVLVKKQKHSGAILFLTFRLRGKEVTFRIDLKFSDADKILLTVFFSRDNKKEYVIDFGTEGSLTKTLDMLKLQLASF